MGSDIMESYNVKSARLHMKGFTLIASLLLLLLLSGMAIGLMMMVNTEGKVGATDLQNNAAYHSAEGGIEKMNSDLAAVFQNAQSPTATQICNLGTLQPNLVGVTWKDYQVTPGVVGAACPSSLTGLTKWGQISSGSNQGLWAQIIPIQMLATAALPGGQEVSMLRTAQVALIPVFQFGVFSDSDLAFFPGSNLDFAGPVHTNGDLYPFAGTGAVLTFHDKLSAYGNVIRTRLPNGFSATTSYAGSVYIPTADTNCSSPGTATSTCKLMDAPANSGTYGDGSVQGAGGNPPSTYNTSAWNTFSKTTANYEIVNGNYGSTTTPGTGAKNLAMPFVGGGALPNEIIHRPAAGESATSALGASREYNMAQIRVLLSDDPADLPGGAADTANNIRLANVSGTYGNQYGIATSTPSGLPALASGNTYNTYFAAASNAIPDLTTCSGITCTASDWPYAPKAQSSGTPNPSLQPAGAPLTSNNGTPTINLCPPTGVNGTSSPTPPANCPTTGAYPYFAPPNGAAPSNSASSKTWNLIDGWLRVEYKDASGTWHPVTMEWLQLGFARGLNPPTTAGSNPYNPNAILLLQEPADRNASGTMVSVGTAPVCNTWNVGHTICLTWTAGTAPEVAADTAALGTAGWWQYGVTNSTTATPSITQYNWYPINFYDVREGEVRDTAVTGNTCTTNGVMNAVEIDVGNLKRWLTGTIGTSGASVDYLAQNGYVLYFSDRRGMLYNPHASANTRTGDAGLEDVINSSSSTGTPDGALDPNHGAAFSPEDDNKNGFLDNWGEKNMGLGFWNSAAQNLNTVIVSGNDPYTQRINSCSTTARKNWVSGARHVLKLVDGSLGNIPLRTDAAATAASPGGFTVASENPVYIQGNYNSNSTDTTWNSTPTNQTGHAAAAVIADSVTLLSNDWTDLKSMQGIVTDKTTNRNPSHDSYYRVAIAGGKNMTFQQPTGTSQDFGTDGGLHNFMRYLEDWSGQTVHYKGSLVSLYYSTYDTGVFKCCTVVYGVPTRDYIFDADFSSPGGLPPGTPLFRDVNSLGYRQLFTARTN